MDEQVEAPAAGGEAADIAQFTDAEGRVWRPRFNLWHVRRFLQETGVGLFATTAKAIATAPPADGDKMNLTPADVEQLVTQMCGGMDNMPVLLWLGCQTEAEKQGVTEQQFCEAIKEEVVGNAIVCAMMAVFEFFPSTSKLSKLLTEVQGEGDETPFPQKAADGPGSKSTDSPDGPA